MHISTPFQTFATGVALAAAGLFAVPASAQQGQNDADSVGNQGTQSSTLMLQGPTGDDVLSVKRNPPREARAGQEVSYTIDVKNVSDFPVQGVTVMETFQGDFEIVSAQTKGQSKSGDASGNNSGDQSSNSSDRQAGGNKQNDASAGKSNSKSGSGQKKSNQMTQFSVDLGTLNAGQTKTVQVTGSAPKEGTVRACLSADYRPTLCTSFDVVAPNLKLTRQILVDARAELADLDMKKNTAYVCDTVSVRYTVKNTGSGESRSVTLRDDLPQGLVTKDGSKAKISEDLGTLDAGETVTREYQLTLAKNRNQGGEFNLSAATAKSKTDTARSGEDTAPLRLLKPELSLNIDGPQEQYLDRPAEYTVTVTNESDDPALDAQVALTPASGASNVNIQSQDADGNTVSLGTLKGGDSREFTVTMTATEPKTVSLSAEANAYCVDAVKKSAKTEFKGIAAILLEVVDQVDPVPVDDTTTYEIYVKNQGSAPDSEVQLTATLPDGMEFVEASGDSKVTANGNELTFKKIPTVAPGDVLSWTVKAKANDAEKVRFRVELTSEANQRPVFELEPTTLY
ncbi:COG1361 family protein [Alienimonas californiensis]|uniref:Large cysteine-rich periplasmic protein OmcB n=1 Tax=Alienimonas californiensis TaxID=2527989 RepID=A0A517PDH3_9PLAN|nr:DUF11 domain-containing protein [Alienimonas californiensis]QDT17428.1 Large cysteine-rich periplasmic protein OmcB [Alienimonas californiensis]